MHCYAKFSLALQNEIFSTETSDFLKQIIFLKSFISAFFVYCGYLGFECGKWDLITLIPDHELPYHFVTTQMVNFLQKRDE